MSEFIYVELEESKVEAEILQKFNCGHPDFNDFLIEDALKESSNGEGVTYILIDKTEFDSGNITAIFAFATIQSQSLHYYKDKECKVCNVENDDKNIYYIPCAEIKYFGIAKAFQKQTAYAIDKNKFYSTIFFEWLLQYLYIMSTRTIGFQMIFLRANEAGIKLYSRKSFLDCSDYIVPYEDCDASNKCIPMGLMITDNLGEIFS